MVIIVIILCIFCVLVLFLSILRIVFQCNSFSARCLCVLFFLSFETFAYSIRTIALASKLATAKQQTREDNKEKQKKSYKVEKSLEKFNAKQWPTMLDHSLFSTGRPKSKRIANERKKEKRVEKKLYAFKRPAVLWASHKIYASHNTGRSVYIVYTIQRTRYVKQCGSAFFWFPRHRCWLAYLD